MAGPVGTWGRSWPRTAASRWTRSAPSICGPGSARCSRCRSRDGRSRGGRRIGSRSPGSVVIAAPIVLFPYLATSLATAAAVMLLCVFIETIRRAALQGSLAEVAATEDLPRYLAIRGVIVQLGLAIGYALAEVQFAQRRLFGRLPDRRRAQPDRRGGAHRRRSSATAAAVRPRSAGHLRSARPSERRRSIGRREAASATKSVFKVPETAQV